MNERLLVGHNIEHERTMGVLSCLVMILLQNVLANVNSYWRFSFLEYEIAVVEVETD